MVSSNLIIKIMYIYNYVYILLDIELWNAEKFETAVGEVRNIM
jgi:hypothetical protein